MLNTGANNGPHGALLIDGDISIDGAGTAETIMDANALSRLIQIRRRSGTVAIPNVKLSNMRLQNGATFSSADENERDGGAIDIRSGQVTITHVSFLNNHAYRQGGAINSSSRLEIKGATFESNSAGNFGGALASNDALSVINSEFNGNHALEGGAIAIAAGNASLTSSTFINNDALDQGGALFVVDGNVTAANLTLVFNTADTHQAAGLGLMGGSTTLSNSIVAFNTNSDGVARNCSPNKLPVDGGHNLQFPAASCGATIAVIDPKLGHFGDNGGPTRTLLPLSLSPAIDAIEFNACSLTDQRGVTRVDGDGNDRTACDIGAAEYTPPQAPRADLSVTVSDSVDPVFGAGDITYTITAFNKGPAPATGVIVSYTLPDRMSLALSPLGCTNSAKIIKCNVGDLAVNAQRQFQFLVRPALDTPSTATSRVPKLNANDISVQEGNSSRSVANFTIKLSPVAAQPVTVDYSVTGGTANAETDFVATSGKLTFSPGQSQLQIPVTINGETRREPDETLILTLTNPVAALIGKASAIMTIKNDD